MLIGAIDVGTNSTRLLIAEYALNEQGDQRGLIKRIHSDLITTRIGQGINDGVLQPEPMTRTLRAIKTFTEKCQELMCQKVILAATSAIRDAQNGQEFANQVHQVTGYQLNIIPGEIEANLSYMGVVQDFAATSDLAVVDIGGGSTEIIWRDNKDELQCTSSKAGAVRMTEGAYDKVAIKERLLPVLEQVKAGGIKRLIGVGGTVTTLAAVKQKLVRYDWTKIHGYRLSLLEIENIYVELARLDRSQRQAVAGLQKERADIILAGIQILLIILEELAVNEITVSESDILYGIIINNGSFN